MQAFEVAGLQVKYKEMENSEKRYSVNLPDGSAWILTVAGKTGGWQNAHYRKGLKELYIVLHGQVAMAEDFGGANFHLSMLRVGEQQTLGAKPHNLFVFPGAVIQTLKYGVPVGNPEKKGNDWWPAENLDHWSKSFANETAIMRHFVRV